MAEKRCTWLGSPEAEAAVLSLGIPRPPLLPSATHALSEHPGGSGAEVTCNLGQGMRPTHGKLPQCRYVCVLTQSCLVLCDPGLEPARLLCPWDCPGKNTGVGCHFLLQGIFLTQESNMRLLHWQAASLLLSYLGKTSVQGRRLLSSEPPYWRRNVTGD